MAISSRKLPLDARLLSEAIIELNISRRHAALYPDGHPLASRSLRRAFDFFRQLFDLRATITLAVAKDTLVIDDYFLDRKNPVYMEFSLHLHRMNIASLTFSKGLTEDELAIFLKFLSEKGKKTPETEPQPKQKPGDLKHIQISFIDYGAFSFDEKGSDPVDSGEYIWERYVYGLLEGTLQSGPEAATGREIPPAMLAKLVNKADVEDLKDESYDRVITTYLRKSSERAFSSKDLKKLLDFINALRPELKKQFLTSTVRAFSKDRDFVEETLKEIPVDKVIALLDTMNEQRIDIPDPLKNLLVKFTKLSGDGVELFSLRDGILADDIFLSPDVKNLLKGSYSSKKYVTEQYQEEIQKLLDFDSSEERGEKLIELEKECTDEQVARDFNHILLEIISTDVVSEEEFSGFIDILKDQTEYFLGTGQFGLVLRIIRVLEGIIKQNRFPGIMTDMVRFYDRPECISLFLDSLKMIDKDMRQDAFLVCDWYGEKIIPSLIETLIEEKSYKIRRLLINLIVHFGNAVIPEAIRHLRDGRWFVKRNMLFILRECGNEEALGHIRPFCHHENPKISLLALKCLLQAGDDYGVKVLRDHLKGESREMAENMIDLSGVFKVRAIVPDLIGLLKKRVISGSDLQEKIPAVRALGQIGDPRALKPLRDLLAFRSFFFKASVEKLKHEIYKTLDSYPVEEAKDLLEKRAREEIFV